MIALFSLEAGAADSAGGAKFLTGKAAMGDWTTDAPGVRRKITVGDLPQPNSFHLAINFPHEVKRPKNAQLQLPFCAIRTARGNRT
jgi:hypothetical protein